MENHFWKSMMSSGGSSASCSTSRIRRAFPVPVSWADCSMSAQNASSYLGG